MSWRSGKQAPIEFEVGHTPWQDWPRGGGMRIMVPRDEHFSPLVVRALEMDPGGGWQARVAEGYGEEVRERWGRTVFNTPREAVQDAYLTVVELIKAEPNLGSWYIL